MTPQNITRHVRIWVTVWKYVPGYPANHDMVEGGEREGLLL